MKEVTFLGLGYIGLPTALICASAEQKVFGFDVDNKKVSELNAGTFHFDEIDIQALYQHKLKLQHIEFIGSLRASDIFVITVPTPINDDRSPDLSFVRKAVQLIATKLRKDDLIILESTCPVGTSDMMINEIKFERPDLFSEGIENFHFCYCPERILPGDTLNELVKNERVIGGNTHSAAMHAKEFYLSFVKSEITLVDLRTAEMSKLIENSFRDVNIAFANEIMRLSINNNVDYLKLIEIANKHPRVNILRPGPGVGGHCIAIDPWFLAHDDNNIAQMIPLSRKINDEQPKYVFNLINEKINALKPNSILFVGVSYKSNSSDTRESPSLKIAEMIIQKHLKLDIVIYDPHVNKGDLKDSKVSDHLTSNLSNIKTVDMVIQCVDHDYLRSSKDYLNILKDAKSVVNLY